MAEWDFVAAPATVSVDFAVSQANIIVNMLHLLNTVEHNDGFSQWTVDTYHALSEEEKRRNQLVSMIIEPGTYPPTYTQFTQILDDIKAADAVSLRDLALKPILSLEDPPTVAQALASADALAEYSHKMATEYGKEDDYDEDAWRWAYTQLVDADAFKQMAVDHLTMMWDRFYRDQWTRNESMLLESRDAYLQMNMASFSDVFAAIEAVTGRNMRGIDKMEKHFDKINHVTFMPVTHLGPYISWERRDDNNAIIFFTARLPSNTRQSSSALNRNELLVRLNALADDTRLSILEMLVAEEELCAQDFINRLDLSQSSASRHLRQLTASGFLNERRRDVAKCYSLNTERIGDTMKALKRLLT